MIPAGENVLNFLLMCGQLKKLKRTGWINNKVKEPESVADHMYRMAICSLLIEDETIDKTKCIKLSIVHDLAEAIVGDITPFDGITVEEKYRREKKALDEICDTLGETSNIKKEIKELWNEYEEGLTSEALIVKDLDKFEMILQAYEYEEDQNLCLDSFFESTKGKFKTNAIKEWAKLLVKKRGNTKKQE